MRLMHCHMAVSIVMRAVDNACHQYIDLARSCVINDRRVPRSSQPVNRQRRPDHWLTIDQCPLCHGQPSREDKFTNRGNCRTAERERCTQGRSHQLRFGGDEVGALAPKNFFCTSPPISAFWGGPNDLSLYRPKDV